MSDDYGTKTTDFYPLQTITLTAPAACEMIGRVLIDGDFIPRGSVADISYAIATKLGFVLP